MERDCNSRYIQLLIFTGGHYVSHLRFNQDWFLANDDQPMMRSSADRQFNVERSSLFFFKLRDHANNNSNDSNNYDDYYT